MPSAAKMWKRVGGVLVFVLCGTVFGFMPYAHAEKQHEQVIVIIALPASHECVSMIDMAHTKRSGKVVCVPPNPLVPEPVTEGERARILGGFVPR